MDSTNKSKNICLATQTVCILKSIHYVSNGHIESYVPNYAHLDIQSCQQIWSGHAVGVPNKEVSNIC
jgi:hypothetical protein